MLNSKYTVLRDQCFELIIVLFTTICSMNCIRYLILTLANFSDPNLVKNFGKISTPALPSDKPTVEPEER